MTPRSPATPGAFPLAEGARRFGLLSADAVVDRYVRLVERELGDAGPAAGPVPPDPGRTTEGVARLTAAYLRLLDTTAALLDGTGGDAAETMVLPPTPAGSCAEGCLWLHDAASPSAPVGFHGTDLVAPDGSTVAASALAFSVLHDSSGAGGPRAVAVRVRVPDGQRPGRYHGLVLATSAPSPLLLVLEVAAPGEGRL